MTDGTTAPKVSCLCHELNMTPENFAKAAQKLRKNPRVIVKSGSQHNHVLHMCNDGTSKDLNMIDKILQGSMTI